MNAGILPYIRIEVREICLTVDFDTVVHGFPPEGAKWRFQPDFEEEDPGEFPDKLLKPYTRVLTFDGGRQIVIKNNDIHGLQLSYKSTGNKVWVNLSEELAVELAELIDNEFNHTSGVLPEGEKEVKILDNCCIFPLNCRRLSKN